MDMEPEVIQMCGSECFLWGASGGEEGKVV
jgi:hypothetical protein